MCLCLLTGVFIVNSYQKSVALSDPYVVNDFFRNCHSDRVTPSSVSVQSAEGQEVDMKLLPGHWWVSKIIIILRETLCYELTFG